jgi:hypothetical protein
MVVVGPHGLLDVPVRAAVQAAALTADPIAIDQQGQLGGHGAKRRPVTE